MRNLKHSLFKQRLLIIFSIRYVLVDLKFPLRVCFGFLFFVFISCKLVALQLIRIISLHQRNLLVQYVCKLRNTLLSFRLENFNLFFFSLEDFGETELGCVVEIYLRNLLGFVFTHLTLTDPLLIKWWPDFRIQTHLFSAKSKLGLFELSDEHLWGQGIVGIIIKILQFRISTLFTLSYVVAGENGGVHLWLWSFNLLRIGLLWFFLLPLRFLFESPSWCQLTFIQAPVIACFKLWQILQGAIKVAIHTILGLRTELHLKVVLDGALFFLNILSTLKFIFLDTLSCVLYKRLLLL